MRIPEIYNTETFYMYPNLQSLYNESKRIISYQKDASDGEWILFYCELCIVKDDVHFLKWYYYCNGMSVRAICENPIKCN